MAAKPRKRATRKPPPVVTIEGEEARVSLHEGAKDSISVSELVDRLHPHVPDSSGIVLPDGVKCMLPSGDGFILVHQTTPSVFLFRWIANDSPRPYGRGAKYRNVRIALPYVIVFAVFERTGAQVPELSSRNECFFVNEPLDRRGLDTELCFPALLNCSKFEDEPGHPLSWICTQHLQIEHEGRPTLQSSVHEGLTALLRHLLESAFNHSSEHHELNSWHSETVSAGVDPRLATVEKWEKATEDDPLFVLDVPWLPTGLSLGDVAKRIGSGRDGRGAASSSADIARVILNARGGHNRELF